jgi:hypothetical protein
MKIAIGAKRGYRRNARPAAKDSLLSLVGITGNTVLKNAPVSILASLKIIPARIVPLGKAA